MTFSIFGWGGKTDNPQRDAINVYNSQFCDPSNPQAFCSVFDFNSTTCSASLGAPLVIHDLESTSIDGFLINEGSCSTNGSNFVLNYHSVGDFEEWIKKVSGAVTINKISFLLILSSALIMLNEFVI